MRTAFISARRSRVYEAHMDAFADHWGFRRQSIEAWRHGGPDHPRPYAVALVAGGRWRRAGRGSALCWHHSGESQLRLGRRARVRRHWRRRGLGLALLLQSFTEFRRRGATRVGLRRRRRRARPARCRCTSGLECRSCAETTRTRSRHEPSARPLPGLPHLHGGRASARATSATPAAARSAPASSACPAPGARAARRWPRRRALRSLSGGGGRREDVLEEQTLAIATDASGAAARARRLLLRAHRRRRGPRRYATGRLALVWFDAHGDLNTPESLAVREPLGNASADAARLRARSSRRTSSCIGARSLDPPEGVNASPRSGCAPTRRSRVGALDGARACYVALDVMSLEPREIAAFMPEPGGSVAGGRGAAPREIAAALARFSVAGFTRSDRPSPRTSSRSAAFCAASRAVTRLAGRRV